MPSLDTSALPATKAPPPGRLATPTGPLHGVRVIDITTMILGPVATLLLGDMGAEVIRIEPPGGDPFRYVGATRHHGMSAAYLGINRNKSSVVLDLKQPAAVEALLQLVESADVFVHNMRASAADRLGIGYEAVSQRKPDIVYAAGVGFGANGPYSDKPAYDDIIQGLSGVAGLGRASADEPAYFPTVIADKVGGYALATAISMALYRKAVSGIGERIEVPMFETMVQFNLLDHFGGGQFAPESNDYGYMRMFSPNHRPLKTRDGYLCLIANTDRQWRRLFTLLGHPAMADDPRFKTIKARIENVSVLYEFVETCLPGRDTAEWVTLFDEQGVPCGPVNRIEDLVNDPHLVHGGFFQTLSHQTEGELRNTSIPVRFERHPGSIRSLAPGLGEHTHAVLSSLGYTSEQIAELSGSAE